jgi:hypothetical protein
LPVDAEHPFFETLVAAVVRPGLRLGVRAVLGD